ncbi:hypothetical protein SK128_005658, partial [Halocaridina rubra]
MRQKIRFTDYIVFQHLSDKADNTALIILADDDEDIIHSKLKKNGRGNSRVEVITKHRSEMPRRLSPAEEEEARQCFAIFGKNGQIPTKELGTALRSLGVNPTNAEVKAVAAELGNPPTVDFSSFL